MRRFEGKVALVTGAGGVRAPEQRVEKRFRRLSQAGVFEAFFEALAGLSRTAHPVRMFASTVVRAHISAAGAAGGRTAGRSAARAAASRPRSTSRLTSMACRSPSI